MRTIPSVSIGFTAWRLFAATLFIAMSLTLPAQKTTRKGLHAAPVAEETSAVAPDTLWTTAGKVEFYGYEKPLQSRKETVHITNLGDSAIVGLKAVITYTDYRGEELHRRTVELPCHIPPGSTRLVEFKSWDVQNRFYYREGPRPRKEAYPYDVAFTIEYLLAEPE